MISWVRSLELFYRYWNPTRWKKLTVYYPKLYANPRPVRTRLMMLTPDYLTNQKHVHKLITCITSSLPHPTVTINFSLKVFRVFGILALTALDSLLGTCSENHRLASVDWLYCAQAKQAWVGSIKAMGWTQVCVFAHDRWHVFSCSLSKSGKMCFMCPRSHVLLIFSFDQSKCHCETQQQMNEWI